MKKILESMTKYAGEPEQKKGDYAKGTDNPKKGIGFLNKLVGETEKYKAKDKSAKLKRKLTAQLAEMKRRNSDRLVPFCKSCDSILTKHKPVKDANGKETCPYCKHDNIKYTERSRMNWHDGPLEEDNFGVTDNRPSREGTRPSRGHVPVPRYTDDEQLDELGIKDIAKATSRFFQKLPKSPKELQRSLAYVSDERLEALVKQLESMPSDGNGHKLQRRLVNNEMKKRHLLAEEFTVNVEPGLRNKNQEWQYNAGATDASAISYMAKDYGLRVVSVNYDSVIISGSSDKQDELINMLKKLHINGSVNAVGDYSNELAEAPIQATDDPMDPLIVGTDANPAKLKYRMQRATMQLQDLAKRAETATAREWQDIAVRFKELTMNINEIEHALDELATLRKKGGANSRGINKDIQEDGIHQSKLDTVKQYVEDELDTDITIVGINTKVGPRHYIINVVANGERGTVEFKFAKMQGTTIEDFNIVAVNGGGWTDESINEFVKPSGRGIAPIKPVGPVTDNDPDTGDDANDIAGELSKDPALAKQVAAVLKK